MLCSACGHADRWHDDRAITACLPYVTVLSKPLRCSCPGWRP